MARARTSPQSTQVRRRASASKSVSRGPGDRHLGDPAGCGRRAPPSSVPDERADAVFRDLGVPAPDSCTRVSWRASRQVEGVAFGGDRPGGSAGSSPPSRCAARRRRRPPPAGAGSGPVGPNARRSRAPRADRRRPAGGRGAPRSWGRVPRGRGCAPPTSPGWSLHCCGPRRAQAARRRAVSDQRVSTRRSSTNRPVPGESRSPDAVASAGQVAVGGDLEVVQPGLAFPSSQAGPTSGRLLGARGARRVADS